MSNRWLSWLVFISHRIDDRIGFLKQWLIPDAGLRRDAANNRGVGFVDRSGFELTAEGFCDFGVEPKQKNSRSWPVEAVDRKYFLADLIS